MVGLPCRQVVVQLDLGQKIRMGRALGSLVVIFALPFPSWHPTVPWFARARTDPGTFVDPGIGVWIELYFIH